MNPSRFVSSSLRGSSIHGFPDVPSLFITRNPLSSSPSSLLHCSLAVVLHLYLFRPGCAFLLLLIEFVAVTASDHNASNA
ncbi:hypothetical protein K435DRAFT_785692, partial [Dendrothele bispora CBS 962.96]